jgi:hypothetical protein
VLAPKTPQEFLEQEQAVVVLDKDKGLAVDLMYLAVLQHLQLLDLLRWEKDTTSIYLLSGLQNDRSRDLLERGLPLGTKEE